MTSNNQESKKSRRAKKPLWQKIIIVLVGLFVLVGIFGDKKPTAQNQVVSSNSQEVVAKPVEEIVKNDPGITMNEFNQLKNGMSYQKVVEIIGGEGELISESGIAGYETKMYKRDGETGRGANANAMFQNNKLMTKAQFGLK